SRFLMDFYPSRQTGYNKQMAMMIDLPAIETVGLRKLFGEKVAVDDLSLTVARGEVFGFLGPNGAGKTTSVKMLLGLVNPTAGKGKLLGRPLGDPSARAKVGFLPEHFRFHDWLTAREFLQLHADLYRMPETVSRERIPALLERVGLTDAAKQKLCEFSKGMLQRIGLAQALLNAPDLVILDEPTSGLDPVGRLHVRDIIHELRENGAAVFLNSHLLSEVEVTCDRVAFIKKGKVVRINPLHALMDGEVNLEIRARPLDLRIAEGLGRWGHNVRLDNDRILLTVAQEQAIPEINRFLTGQGIDVFAIVPSVVSLESLFMEVIGDDGGM
ncbi:MAG TPA: ABC transporter ATP-binding protein, partial [Anaerolineaceae bacterium]|nr:ABC transporter ATP-binding protein [Anaerolineaceae bacterium]